MLALFRLPRRWTLHKKLNGIIWIMPDMKKKLPIFWCTFVNIKKSYENNFFLGVATETQQHYWTWLWLNRNQPAQTETVCQQVFNLCLVELAEIHLLWETSMRPNSSFNRNSISGIKSEVSNRSLVIGFCQLKITFFFHQNNARPHSFIFSAKAPVVRLRNYYVFTISALSIEWLLTKNFNGEEFTSRDVCENRWF